MASQCLLSKYHSKFSPCTTTKLWKKSPQEDLKNGLVLEFILIVCFSLFFDFSGTVCYTFKQLRWPSGKSIHLGSWRLRFDPELGQTNDLKIGIHSFPAWRSALKGNKPASLLVVSLGKALSGIPPSWCDKQMAGKS